MGMKVWIDQDLCTGDGLCEEIAPDVFTLLDDGLAYVKEGSKVFSDPGGVRGPGRGARRHGGGHHRVGRGVPRRVHLHRGRVAGRSAARAARPAHDVRQGPVSTRPSRGSGEHRAELLVGQGVGGSRPVGRDGERHADDLPGESTRRATGVTGLEVGGEDEDLPPGRVRVVQVAPDRLDPLTDRRRATPRRRPGPGDGRTPRPVAPTLGRPDRQRRRARGRGTRSTARSRSGSNTTTDGVDSRLPSRAQHLGPLLARDDVGVGDDDVRRRRRSRSLLHASARHALDLHGRGDDARRPRRARCRAGRRGARVRARPRSGRRRAGSCRRRPGGAARRACRAARAAASSTAWAIARGARLRAPASPARRPSTAVSSQTATSTPTRPADRARAPGRPGGAARAAGRGGGWRRARDRRPGRGRRRRGTRRRR